MTEFANQELKVNYFHKEFMGIANRLEKLNLVRIQFYGDEKGLEPLYKKVGYHFSSFEFQRKQYHFDNFDFILWFTFRGKYYENLNRKFNDDKHDNLYNLPTDTLIAIVEFLEDEVEKIENRINENAKYNLDDLYDEILPLIQYDKDTYKISIECGKRQCDTNSNEYKAIIFRYKNNEYHAMIRIGKYRDGTFSISYARPLCGEWCNSYNTHDELIAAIMKYKWG